jgi:prephenate dehydratase
MSRLDQGTGAATPVDARSGAPKVAFQGAPGAFSEEALLSYFSGAAESLPCREFQAVVDAVETGDAAYGVLPVENTLAGSVVAAYDALADGHVRIVGEIILPIRHCLLGLPGSRVEGIRRIVSHPVALAQCTRFLSSQRSAESVAVYDTAGAAEEVARGGDPEVAAVAARGAARRYGLQILAADIQDRDDNQTRFYVVVQGREPDPAPRPEPPSASPSTAVSDGPPWKSVVLLEVEDRPGALMDILAPLARAGINLTKLQSRPGEVPWRYRFIFEMAAHSGAEPAAEALRRIQRHSTTFRVLGSFLAARDAAPDAAGASSTASAPGS